MSYTSYWTESGKKRSSITIDKDMIGELDNLIFWIESIELKKKIGWKITGHE
jgi:hypothetical protein